VFNPFRVRNDWFGEIRDEEKRLEGFAGVSLCGRGHNPSWHVPAFFFVVLTFYFNISF